MRSSMARSLSAAESIQRFIHDMFAALRIRFRRKTALSNPAAELEDTLHGFFPTSSAFSPEFIFDVADTASPKSGRPVRLSCGTGTSITDVVPVAEDTITSCGAPCMPID